MSGGGGHTADKSDVGDAAGNSPVWLLTAVVLASSDFIAFPTILSCSSNSEILLCNVNSSIVRREHDSRHGYIKRRELMI